MELRVVPAAEAGWTAVDAVMQAEATSRDCQCQFHLLDNAGYRATTRESRRGTLQEQIETWEPPRGLVALLDGEPAGWCGVEPRTRMAHLLASRLVAKNSPYPAGDPGVWAIYCLLVPPRHRRQGLAAAMLTAAVAYARAAGATALEGYPMDLGQRGGKLPSGFSTGTTAMFAREGFAPVAALPSGRTLMHRPAALP